MTFADLRESDFVLLPLQALDGVSLPPEVGLQLGTKLIWHATARSLHGPGKDKTQSAQNRVRNSTFNLCFEGCTFTT